MNRGMLYMALAVFFFSLMNLSVKFLSVMPTLELVFFRSLVSAILAYGTLRYVGIYPWGQNRKLLVLRGLIGFVGLATFFATVQHMPLATAMTIQYTSPIFVALWSQSLLGEKMRTSQWIWFGISFVGVVMIKGFDWEGEVKWAYLAIGIFSAVASGLAYTSVRKLREYDHPLVVTFFFPLVTLPLSGASLLVDWVTPMGWDWVFLLATGVFAQLGQMFLTYSLHAERANIVGSIQYIGILFAWLYGYYFFKETYAFGAMAGMMLVVAGVVLNLLTARQKSGKGKTG